jgi:separase
MVANLWDVTDKDIDRFLACLLSSWLSDKGSSHPRTLLDVIPKARAACRLPYLIGAAPVVYGFPVFLKPS